MDQAQYSNLRSLLRADKARAKECIETLKRDASRVKELIEEEMMSKYGCKWKVYRHRSLRLPTRLIQTQVNVGFHAVPSMEYVSSFLSHGPD
jgi:aprataxin